MATDAPADRLSQVEGTSYIDFAFGVVLKGSPLALVLWDELGIVVLGGGLRIASARGSSACKEPRRGALGGG